MHSNSYGKIDSLEGTKLHEVPMSLISTFRPTTDHTHHFEMIVTSPWWYKGTRVLAGYINIHTLKVQQSQ
jgi:hypothetical protein